ncbi:hypothetical protein ACFSAV_05260 [Pasteurella oralis]|uniref:Uncharacterized protein n=1 Tax=Pasteurella oralis TaxID=1071947 RepID=A0ABW4NU41_9PAST
MNLPDELFLRYDEMPVYLENQAKTKIKEIQKPSNSNQKSL